MPKALLPVSVRAGPHGRALAMRPTLSAPSELLSDRGSRPCQEEDLPGALNCSVLG